MRLHTRPYAGIAALSAAFLLSPREVHAFSFPVPPPVLDPKTYVSPSGHFTLLVDPADIHGRGRATYRLSRDGREVWSAEQPFNCQCKAWTSNDT
jgi:hypothetical protein